MAEHAPLRKLLLVVAIVGAFALVIGAIVVRLQRLPDGPVDIAWDHETCAHCRMLIGDPSFAAQIQTTDGRVLDFDDPGCLLAYEAANHPKEHAVWFHDLHGAGWLPASGVAFVTVPKSPMGYDLGAAPRGTPGAISIDEARARVLAPRRHDDMRGATDHGAP